MHISLVCFGDNDETWMRCDKLSYMKLKTDEAKTTELKNVVTRRDKVTRLRTATYISILHPVRTPNLQFSFCYNSSFYSILS